MRMHVTCVIQREMHMAFTDGNTGREGAMLPIWRAATARVNQRVADRQ